MGKKPEIYPFFKANIHERRWMASIVRGLPMAIFLAVCFLLAYGLVENERLLLAVCAVLNTAMWLFVTSTCLFGIAGSWKVMTEIDSKAAKVSNLPGAAQAAPSSGDNDSVVHVIVLPNYKEDELMLAETLTCLTQAVDSRTFHVCLAMEEREGEAGGEKAVRLQERFKEHFADFFVTVHPADLNQEHQDLSIDLEVPGKASNLKYAVQRAVDRVQSNSALSIGNVLLTVADADCLFHPCYFSNITQDFNMLREGPGAKHQWCMWQAPQLSFRDHWRAPLCSRIWTYVSSMYEFGSTSSLHWGGHHMVFSGYTMPLQLARDADSWDGDVIAEDHHAYLKNFFYSAHTSAMEAYDDPNFHIFLGGGCEPMLEVRPVFLPVKSTPVISGGGYWQSYQERWHQARRHAQGAAELPYALLVCWDIFQTLPLHSWSFYLVYKLFRVLIRLFCMHLLPICQGIALGAMSLYWFWLHYHLREITTCPHTMTIWHLRGSEHGEYLLCVLAGAWTLVWPIVVPFALVIMANCSFFWSSFLQPGKAKFAEQFTWYREDGEIPEAWWSGSKRMTGSMLIAVDIALFMGIMMVPYGFIAVLLAYWQVCFYGNRFKYITAAKAIKTNSEYGSIP